MTSVLNIALSGLRAAETRMANSANNIANAGSTRSIKDGEAVNEPYVPTRVEQTALPEGGVVAKVVADNNPTVPIYNPENAGADENGIVQYPNVSLEGETVEQITAAVAYEANLTVIKTEKSLMDKLLDIFG